MLADWPTPTEPAPSRWEIPSSGPTGDTDIVAMGADLEPGTLLAAYRRGLFPMPFDRKRIAWFSPQRRGIIPLDGLRMTRSLRRSMGRYTVATDTCFREVIEACADRKRPNGWINSAFIDAYERLHNLGWAHSIESFDTESGELVGGLYGVAIGGLFAGESMFHRATDASKVALVNLVEALVQRRATLLDVQWTTTHLESLGAIEIDRCEYLQRLATALGDQR